MIFYLWSLPKSINFSISLYLDTICFVRSKTQIKKIIKFLCVHLIRDMLTNKILSFFKQCVCVCVCACNRHNSIYNLSKDQWE